MWGQREYKRAIHKNQQIKRHCTQIGLFKASCRTFLTSSAKTMQHVEITYEREQNSILD